MNREQMVEKVSEQIFLGALAGQPNKQRAELILNAIMPQVTTVAELEALPYRSVLVGTDGWVTRWMAHRDASYILAEASALPLTVVWQPEATDD